LPTARGELAGPRQLSAAGASPHAPSAMPSITSEGSSAT